MYESIENKPTTDGLTNTPLLKQGVMTEPLGLYNEHPEFPLYDLFTKPSVGYSFPTTDRDYLRSIEH